MLRDVEYFQSRLGKIDGFEDAAEYLTNIIKSKEIKSPPPPPPPSPPAPTEDAERKAAQEPAEILAQDVSEKNGGSNNGDNEA
jgi:vacuolar protein sorting-associated protein 54